MPGVSVGTVSISCVPSARGFTEALRSQVLPGADALGKEIGERINAGVKSALRDVGVTVTANTADADAGLAGVKTKLDDLAKARPEAKVAVDAADANARVAQIQARMDRLNATIARPEVTPQMTDAQAKIDKLQQELDDLGKKEVTPKVTADTEATQAKLDALTARLAELQQKNTQVKVSASADLLKAQADLDRMRLKLDEIGSRDVTPRVGLDDSSFNRQIDEDKAKLDALNGSSLGLGGIPGGLLTGGILGAVTAAPALPGVLAGGGAAIGTLGLAVQGISPALSAYTAAQTAAATATGKTGAAAISAASQIHSAQQAVAAAETQAAHDAITSAESVKNAQQAVAQATQQAATSRIGATEQVTRAEQQVAAAEQQLADAQYAEKTAQQALTDARQQAILTLQQLHNAEADTALSAEQAQLDLEQATLNAAATDKSATATALQKQQADLSVREAQQRLKEALQAKANAANNANKADKEGVNGLPAVVSAAHSARQAQQGVADAQRNLTNSHQGVADAQRNLTAVEQQGAAAITKAQQSLSDAVRNASWQQQGDALAVGNAQYRLHDAYATASTGSTSAATAAAKYAYALSQLSPGGQQMVKDIIGFKAGFDSLKTVAQGAIAPGFTGFLKGVHTLMPIISEEVRRMGAIIGGALTAMGQAFQTSGFQATLKELFTQGNQFLQIVGPAIGAFLTAFGEAGAKSGPAVTGLAKGLAAIITGLGDLMTNLAPAAGAIGAVFQTLGEAIGAVGGPLGSILADVARLLAPILSAALPVFKTLLGDLVKALDPLVKALLPPLRETLADLAAPLQKGGALLGQMATAVGQVIIALLPLLPPLAKLAVALMPVFIQQFAVAVPIIRGVAFILSTVVQVLAPAVTWITNMIAAGVNWITNLNNIKTVMSDVASFLVSEWNQIYQNVSAIIGHIINFYRQSWDTISGGVKTAYNAVSSFITGSWDKTYKGIASIVGTIVSFLSGSWTKMTTDAKNIWNGLVTWVTGSLPNAFKSAFQSVVDGIAGVWGKLKDIAKVPINFIIDPIYDKGVVGVVNAVAGLIGMHPLAAIPKLAGGGKITQGTTAVADDVLARVSKNETVVSAEHSRQLAPIFAAVGVPGYADGGVPSGNAPAVTGRFGPIPGVGGVVGDLGHMLAGLTGDALAAAAKLVLDPLLGAMPGGGTTLGAAIKKIPVKIVDGLVARLKGTAADGSIGGGSGADVAKYAASFATGKGHPYVWGGSSPGGWDCSGASAFWYEHFGYFPEHQGTRHGTSESQFTDPLLQGSGAVPGALAFFKGSGGAPPGHVGVVLNPKSFVSAYDTAEGTVVKPISGAMGYRIPKGGFQAAGGTTPGSMSASAISALWTKDDGRASAAGNMARIAFAESGDVPGTVQKGQPPGLTGYGLYQITPTSGIAQNGKFGNLLNASNNTKAAISLYNASGYSPWASDPVAKALLAAGHKFDSGGWMPPGLSLNLNGTGRPEPVLTGAQWDMISGAVQGGDGGFGMVKLHKKFDRMIHLLEQAPGRTAGGVAGALDGTARRAVQRAYFSTR